MFLKYNLEKEIFLDIIDNNPCERVRKQLPEVIVPDFPKKTSELEKFIIEIYKNY